MTCPKSVKTAAVVSQAFIIVWAVLSLLAVIFQNSFAGFFISRHYLENSDKIIPVVTIIYCFKAILLSAANVLMCKCQSIRTPLIMTAVTMGVFPVIVSITINIQVDYYSEVNSNIVSHFFAVNSVESLLSNLLSTAAIITVAAAAVYAYAKKNTLEKSEEIVQE